MNRYISKNKIIEQVCYAISDNDLIKSEAVINSKYPFVPLNNVGRKYTNYQKTKIFIRDGFITGIRVIN